MVTQALGSRGPSLTAQPDLLSLDLGSASSRGREKRAGLPFSPGTGGKAEEVGKGGGKAESKKGGEEAAAPLVPRPLLGSRAGWLPPSAPILSSTLGGGAPSFTALFNSVLPLP